MSQSGLGSGLSCVPLERMWNRVELARSDSDTALFYDLMFLGELTMKLVIAGMLSSLEDDRDRHRYRLERKLVRANGLGDWVGALDDLLTGPASQCLIAAAATDKRELMQNWAWGTDAWQRQAIDTLDDACRGVDKEFASPPGKASLTSWFHAFARLRNRTRAHGAVTAASCNQVCPPLERSIRLLTDNFSLFKRPWVFLHRNLSGKYRVIRVCGDATEFTYLKSDKDRSEANGLSIGFSATLRPLHLIETDLDLSDFYIANGGFRERVGQEPRAQYELLSYVTDRRRFEDASDYLLPAMPLPSSETEGYPDLDPQGKSFGNVPSRLRDYVVRPELEQALKAILCDDRHPIVSLVGRGGVGKTSVALEVLHQIASEERYFALLWFSARDIDLLPQGPRLVTPKVRTQQEIADEFVSLMRPAQARDSSFLAITYLARHLSGEAADGPFLFVFDNFETVTNPAELYEFIDAYIRLPNKVLITSRDRDFKADYPVEVRGMTRNEFDELVRSTSVRLGVASKLTSAYLDQLFDESDGHPYVVKILLGEVARTGVAGSVERVIASKDETLNALFERTFSALSPAAERVFLTLCNWRSFVPRLALEAALVRPRNEPMDVHKAISRLEQSSMIETVRSQVDGVEFLRVPLAAAVFGARKLRVSPLKAAVDVDTQFLQAFGAMRATDVNRGLAPRVDRMIGTVSDRLQQGEDISDDMSILEYVALHYPPTWLRIAELQLEAPDYDTNLLALSSFERYLEIEPTDRDAWDRMAGLCRRFKDPAREVNARFRMASMLGAPFEDLSGAANCLNSLLAARTLSLDGDEKRIMLEELLGLLLARQAEADATDYSRIAWLFLHLQRQSDAEEMVRRGLSRDPGNSYCLRLGEKLGL